MTLVVKLRDYISYTLRPFEAVKNLDTETERYSPIYDDDFQGHLSDYMLNAYGDLTMLKRLEFPTMQGVADEVKFRCRNVYQANRYKYEHLYATIIAEYDPISNYDMVEQEGIANGTIKVDKSEYGKQIRNVDTTDYEHADDITLDAGKRHGKVIDDIAEHKQTKGGKDTVTDTTVLDHIKYPYDTISQVQKEYTDAHSEGDITTQYGSNVTDSPYKDEHISDVDKYQDKTTMNYDEHNTNSVTTDEEHSDKTTSMDNGLTARTLTRSGNVGVTTSQQMLESERQIAMFSLYKVVAQDLIKRLCICIY